MLWVSSLHLPRPLLLPREFSGGFHMAAALGVAALLFYLATLPPGILSVDGNSMLAVSESLVSRLDFTVPPPLGTCTRDGRCYSAWYPLLSVAAAPLVALGFAVASIVNLPAHYVAAVFVLFLPALCTALTTSLVVLLALELGATGRGAYLAATGFAFGSIGAVYAGKFFAEPLLACLVAGSLYIAFSGAQRHFLAAALSALAVLAKPTGIVVGPILSGYHVARRGGWQRTLAPLAGTVFGTALYAGYNVARFGAPAFFGDRPGFGASAFGAAVLGLTVSPGRGLLWYCPAVLASAWAGPRVWKQAEARVVAVLAVALAVLYSLRPYDWDGGWSWGPRYLLPILPGLFAIAGCVPRQKRKLLSALVVVGVLVNAPTSFSFYERYYQEAAESGIPWRDVIWSPTHAPALRAWPAALAEVRDALRSDVRDLVQEAGKPESEISAAQMLRVVAVWWWLLPAVGVPRWTGAAIAVAFLWGSSWLLRAAWPMAPAEEPLGS